MEKNMELTKEKMEKNMDGGSIRECFEKFVSGLEAKEENLKAIQESITESSKQLDLRRESIEDLLLQVTKKEEELKKMQLAEEKGLRDFEMKKKKEMDLMWEIFEGQQNLVEEELEKLEDFKKSLNEKWKMKEKILAFRAEALDAKEKELVSREKLLDLINTDELHKNPNINIGADDHDDDSAAVSARKKAECSRKRYKRKKIPTMILDSGMDMDNRTSPMPLPAPQNVRMLQNGSCSDQSPSHHHLRSPVSSNSASEQ